MMDYEEKGNQLDEHIQKFREEKEALERQIAFHKDFIIPMSKAGPELESEDKLVASLESDYSEILKKEQVLQSKLRTHQSKEFDFGWTKRGTDEVLEKTGGRLGTHSSERRALEIIAERGGEVGFGAISSRMRVGYDYARLLCVSLAKADYADISSGGKCKITLKGENEVDRIS